MKIKEVIATEPITVASYVMVSEAARMMEEVNCAFLPIVDGGRVVGVVTDRDLAIRSGGYGIDSSATTVSRLMSHPPVCIEPDADIEEAARLMLAKNVRRLLVTELDERLIGVISVLDLAGKLTDQALRETMIQFAMINHPNPVSEPHNSPIPGLFMG